MEMLLTLSILENFLNTFSVAGYGPQFGMGRADQMRIKVEARFRDARSCSAQRTSALSVSHERGNLCL
jgi:hypothetical protein